LVIPSQDEQQKIIELASVQNQRIKAENDEIRKLTSLKAALMDDLLTGCVRVTPLLANS
jgi:type I restriction enzyme S subunit